jgi:hypothetical protein
VLDVIGRGLTFALDFAHARAHSSRYLAYMWSSRSIIIIASVRFK